MPAGPQAAPVRARACDGTFEGLHGFRCREAALKYHHLGEFRQPVAGSSQLRVKTQRLKGRAENALRVARHGANASGQSQCPRDHQVQPRLIVARQRIVCRGRVTEHVSDVLEQFNDGGPERLRCQVRREAPQQKAPRHIGHGNGDVQAAADWCRVDLINDAADHALEFGAFVGAVSAQ